MMLVGTRGALTLDGKGATGVPYEMEETRGYQWQGSLWSPGYFRADAAVGEPVSLIASAEPWDTVVALSPGGAAAGEQERRRARRRHVPAAQPGVRDCPAASRARSRAMGARDDGGA